MKKNFIKVVGSMLCALLLLGTLSVSAADPAEETAAETVDPEKEADISELLMPVYLVVEGPDELYTILNGQYPIDGSVSAGDVVADLLSEYHPDREIVGLEDGYIASIDGVSAGTFGGWDGWLYAVKYYTLVPSENGVAAQMSIDIPTVGINDYAIIAPCQILLYYGEFDDSFAGVTYAEDGTLQLVTFTAVYDENYVLTSFETAPLAGGTFTFEEIIVNEDGSVTIGEPIVFTADENGLTGIDATFSQLPNGTYFGSAGKQSDVTAEVNGETVSKPEVVRSSDVYVVYNEPDPEEEFIKKVELLLIGMM
ncbi:MAG: hypothetical protein IJ493_11655 [Clostridia bacterium]|nr:hypothetical protein [Clostridia bacterium]